MRNRKGDQLPRRPGANDEKVALGRLHGDSLVVIGRVQAYCRRFGEKRSRMLLVAGL